MNNKEFSIIYPLSLVILFTMLMDLFGFHPSDSTQGFTIGVIVMYFSWLLVYFIFLRGKNG